MNTLKINELIFKEIIPNQEIENRIREIASLINSDYQDKRPIFIPVLNGSFAFAANLIMNINIPCEVSFIKLKSYQGMKSKGYIDEIMGLDANLSNRHIIIVEDIVESGLTTKHLINKLLECRPASIQIATLLHKPIKLKEKDHPLKYICFIIEDEYVIGYGLDLDGHYRNLSSIYQLVR
ncbi:MAG: hypoxanthine phosphoribosyltransferase [Prevotella sp.]|nr:hypoxanthine phosphoribosyltransferase [Prevotella sp.]